MQKKSLNEFNAEFQASINNGEFEESISILSTGITQYPNENKLKLNLGNVYKVLGQIDNAINVYTTLLSTSLKNTKRAVGHNERRKSHKTRFWKTTIRNQPKK